MAYLKVNTDAVTSAAQKISGYNLSIKNEFTSVVNAMSGLDSSWDGAASENAISRFNEVKSQYPDDRYAVVDNYVNFLLQQVGEGYVQTETANTSLADAFK